MSENSKNTVIVSEESPPSPVQSPETQPSANAKCNGQRPPVFYRVTRCPNCGEDDLNHFDFGVFQRSDFLGVTSGGETGVDQTTMDGDCNHVVMCRNCDHRIFDDSQDTNEDLLEWAMDNGQETEMLEFLCPICESQDLYAHKTGIEISQEVVAVYPAPDESGGEHRIALDPNRYIDYAATRYRCHRDHELTKGDGRPVETADDLVEWLRAHLPNNRG